MRAHRYVLAVGACSLALTLLALAQSPKAGLYEVTNKMTWQHSPFPDGMQAPAGSEGPHTAQTCVTQSQIDKYNGPKPEANGGCQISNIQKRGNSMTAAIVCTGSMKGKGTIRSTWVDSGHSRGKVHFTGSMQVGPNTKNVEWTVDSESTFVGSDCGGVKPATVE